jgi:hypothetical protein
MKISSLLFILVATFSCKTKKTMKRELNTPSTSNKPLLTKTVTPLDLNNNNAKLLLNNLGMYQLYILEQITADGLKSWNTCKWTACLENQDCTQGSFFESETALPLEVGKYQIEASCCFSDKRCGEKISFANKEVKEKPEKLAEQRLLAQQKELFKQKTSCIKSSLLKLASFNFLPDNKLHQEIKSSVRNVKHLEHEDFARIFLSSTFSDLLSSAKEIEDQEEKEKEEEKNNKRISLEALLIAFGVTSTILMAYLKATETETRYKDNKIKIEEKALEKATKYQKSKNLTKNEFDDFLEKLKVSSPTFADKFDSTKNLLTNLKDPIDNSEVLDALLKKETDPDITKNIVEALSIEKAFTYYNNILYKGVPKKFFFKKNITRRFRKTTRSKGFRSLLAGIAAAGAAAALPFNLTQAETLTKSLIKKIHSCAPNFLTELNALKEKIAELQP